MARRDAVAGRAQATVTPRERVRDQRAGPDLWLAFAPVKRARIDLIAEKATELGVAAIVPVMTENTSVSRVNTDRLRANTIEAAEQCGSLTLPEIRQPVCLADLLADWPVGRRLMVCDETGGGEPVLDALQRIRGAAESDAWGILTGPEGGFSRSELDLMAENPICYAGRTRTAYIAGRYRRHSPRWSAGRPYWAIGRAVRKNSVYKRNKSELKAV